MSDGLKTIIGFIIAAGAITAFVIGMAYLGTRYECNNYYEATGRETKTVALSCYVKTDDGWYLLGQVKVIK